MNVFAIDCNSSSTLNLHTVSGYIASYSASRSDFLGSFINTAWWWCVLCITYTHTHLKHTHRPHTHIHHAAYGVYGPITRFIRAAFLSLQNTFWHTFWYENNLKKYFEYILPFFSSKMSEKRSTYWYLLCILAIWHMPSDSSQNVRKVMKKCF